MVDLTISIATRNNKNLLRECLNSLGKNTSVLSKEVYVVDRESEDGTKEMLNNEFPFVKLISSSSKNSFAKNHNMVIKIASGKAIVILNDDTVIKNHALDKAYAYLLKNPGIGALGPRVVNADGSYQHSAFKFPGLGDFLWNEFFFKFNAKSPAFYDGIEHVTTPTEVDWLLGACLILLKTTIEEIGALDEAFTPIYYEDTDLCKRIKDSGYKVVYYPEAEIIHYGAQTVKRQDLPAWLVLRKNRIKFYKKHCAAITVFFAKCILMVSNALNRIRLLIRRK